MKKKNATSSPKRFTKKQGQALIALARQTIMKRFGEDLSKQDIDTMMQVLKDKKLSNSHATFVTINKHDQLRGCIGSLTAVEPLTDSVKRNAINAAFHDHRFSPLTEDELSEIEIEISILPSPNPSNIQTPRTLLKSFALKKMGLSFKRALPGRRFCPRYGTSSRSMKSFFHIFVQKQAFPLKHGKT
jgi:AmmeMemoRadiSam system protein A